MRHQKRFISLKAKIMLSTLIPVVISLCLICYAVLSSLFTSLHEAAKAELLQISQKHAVTFERQLSNAMNYLTVTASMLERDVSAGDTDRIALREKLLLIFDNYGLVDGSSVYFEPNMFDGQDADFAGTQYGTAVSGRIGYYFYKDKQRTAYLPEALQNDIEFTLPHYTEAQKSNKPVYTEPAIYEVDGRTIPMFTLTYPVRGREGAFIGAVTADLFLDDMDAQVQAESIYAAGYVVITNDNGYVVYSPDAGHIGQTREAAGLSYPLPDRDGDIVIDRAVSILNGEPILLSVETICIPQLDRCFYLSAAAPLAEINAGGYRLLMVLVTVSVLIVIIIIVLLYYLIERISRPIRELTQSADSIASGRTDTIAAFQGYHAPQIFSDEVNTLAMSLTKMVAQLEEGQNLKLLTLELEHKREKAEAAARAKSDFLAKMSHQIRTPLNAVMGMTELILRKDLPQDVYENALTIKTASNNLLSIVNDILDFSKIESGKLEIAEAPYLLPSLVHDVISVIRVRLIDEPIQFIVYIDPSLPASLIGDELRIRQMITNLLSNAVKYTLEGHISLTITGTADGETATLSIEVADSGVGIKEEDIGKLFGDFVQIDPMRSHGIEGTGLGLAITRNLCVLMGGGISVQSEYGKGSAFTITLPQRLEKYEPFAKVIDAAGKSVLLYEPRPLYRDSVARTLESLGVAYKSAASIPELFQNLDQYPYVFVSSFAHGSLSPVLSKMDKPPALTLLSNMLETAAPKNARLLTLPVHALSVANILNNVEEDWDGAPVSGASFTAPDAEILIVDDVTANLKVAEGLLLPYQTKVTLCPGGRQAVDMVALNRYDLVFMDHMMPEIDGLEATRQIREMDGEYFKTLPIVALTANAVSGVREMFIQNGMTDFLAKPVETAKLDFVLAKWIPKNKQKKRIVVVTPPESSAFTDMMRSVPALSVDKALAIVGGSATTYERIVRLSIRLLPENITKLSSLIESDMQNYTIEAHGMKGVLNNIGAYGLGAKAFALEELSKGGDYGACARMHLSFIEELTLFHDMMTALLAEENAPAKEAGDMRMLSGALAKLREAVDYYDSDQSLEILSQLGRLSFGRETDDMIQSLTDTVELFDFDQAVIWIEKLEGEILHESV